MKTTFLKSKSESFVLIDGNGAILGRLCAYVASRLCGKYSTMFSRNIECGDHVIIVNARGVVSNSNKILYKHTGYPGGIKSISLRESLSIDPLKSIRKTVSGMLPKNALSDRICRRRLHIFNGEDHNMHAQKPTKIDFLSINRKNKA